MLDGPWGPQAGYISPAIPASRALPDASFPVATAADLAVAVQHLQSAVAGSRQMSLAALNAYLHDHPELMAAWAEYGTAPSVMPYPRGSFR